MLEQPGIDLPDAILQQRHVTFAGRIVTIEIFASSVPVPGGDPSGYGEGQKFLGSVTPNGAGRFTVILPPVAKGTVISATATDAAGNTSEFAFDVVAGP